MDTLTKVRIVVFGVMAIAIVALVLALAVQGKRHAGDLVVLQNRLAQRDQTIEVQRGLYTKLSEQTKNVQGALDSRDVQVRELEDQIRKAKQQLLDASTLVVRWKKAYEGMANATQTVVPPDPKVPLPPGAVVRTKVDFHEDFGYVKVDGWTITNPAQSWVRLLPGRALRITLALSQDRDKAWHTYATSSEDNIDVNIQVTAVDPYVLQPRWYEHVGVAVDLGAGTNQAGFGALVGVGLNYQFMQFTLGPHVWLGLNDRVDRYFGVQFEWRPFQRK